MARLPISVVIGTAALAVAGAYAQAARPGSAHPVVSPGPRTLATYAAYRTHVTPTDYTGSESCRRCHEAEYDSWRRTLHAAPRASITRVWATRVSG